MLRALIDPNTAPLRALPRDDRDLFIAATNSHVPAFDNVSALPWWLSDNFCRLATGGGFSARQLWTDQDETLFDAMRPVILNGIEASITRPDLADRALLIVLDSIPEDRRRPERELWAAFERERPAILGVLLDAVAYGLREEPRTRLERVPRMADFALWAHACEGALWVPFTFLGAYNDNRNEALETVIDADLFAQALRRYVTACREWTGTAGELLGALTISTPDAERSGKSWPPDATRVSGHLRRILPSLRRIGIKVEFSEPKKRPRLIRIKAQVEQGGDSASAVSPVSAPPFAG
jgi:hypothetical protein